MKTISILAFLLVCISCSLSKKVVRVDKCPKIYKNDFTAIVSEKHETTMDTSSASYNEIRFECVYSALFTHKVMHDTFGKLNKVIFPQNNTHPILVWKNVDLFANGKKI